MTVLNDANFMATLQTVKLSLFRLELQPEYAETGEDEAVAAFLAGTPIDPMTSPGSPEWYAQVGKWRDQGIQIERVRVQEDPPTEYQRWERWVGAWNITAGESMRYMTRQHAYDVGLLPAAGVVDWWLMDSNRLITMHFDEKHRRIRTELVDEPTAVAAACGWRDLAVHHSMPETFQGIASQSVGTS